MCKTIVITGVPGFLGRYIARRFHSLGWRVIGVGRAAEENAPSESLQRYVRCTLPWDGFLTLVQEEKPNAIVHCAGRASPVQSACSPLADYQSNTVVTFELLEQIRNSKADCAFVNLSSAAVYGQPDALPVNEVSSLEPLSPYGFHKWQSELVCVEYTKLYGLKTCNLRVFSAYGPGLRRQVLWDLTNKALNEETVVVAGRGVESRDFIHASDVAKAVELVLQHAPMNGESYNVGSGVEVKISNIASLIVEATYRSKRIVFSGEHQKGLPVRWCADIAKLRSLGFEPAWSVERGIQDYAAWAAPLLRS